MTGIGGSLSRAIMIASQDPGPAVSSPLPNFSLRWGGAGDCEPGAIGRGGERETHFFRLWV
jgi:hypothetical protein